MEYSADMRQEEKILATAAKCSIKIYNLVCRYNIDVLTFLYHHFLLLLM